MKNIVISRFALIVSLTFGLFFGVVLPAAHAEEPDYSALPIPELTQKAEAGDAEAQFYLGLMYVEGKGVLQNYQQAAYWLRKSAEQGDASAQYNIGFMYYNGQGVAQNYSEVMKWWHKAAEQGHAKAHYGLGLMYSNGLGVLQDDVLAYALFNLAAKGEIEGSEELRNKLVPQMTSEQIAEGQAISTQWKVGQPFLRLNSTQTESFSTPSLDKTSDSSEASSTFLQSVGLVSLFIVVCGILFVIVILWAKEEESKSDSDLSHNEQAPAEGNIELLEAAPSQEQNTDVPQTSGSGMMKQYYSLALEEINNGIFIPDLKELAMSRAGGDKKLFVRHYVMLRAKQLQPKENSMSNQYERKVETASGFCEEKQVARGNALKIVIFVFRFVRAIFGVLGGWQILAIASGLGKLMSTDIASVDVAGTSVVIVLKVIFGLVFLSAFFLLRKAINSLHMKFYREEKQPLLSSKWHL